MVQYSILWFWLYDYMLIWKQHLGQNTWRDSFSIHPMIKIWANMTNIDLRILWKTRDPSFPERFQEGHNRRSRVQGPGLGVGWCWFLNPHVSRISPDTFSLNSAFGIHLWYKNFSKCGWHSKQTQDAVQIDRPYYLCLRDNMTSP